MGRLLSPSGPELRRLLTGFRHTAFRLETLQRYAMPYEAEPLRRFLAGEPPPEDPDKEQWLRRVRAAAAAGKRMRRVHVVIEPLSDYLRFELAWEYSSNVAAGEQIGIIPTAPGTWPAEVPRHDYWLLDSQTLAIMRYDGEGHLLSVELEDDPVTVVRHNYWRDAAWHQAIPYEAYMGRHGDLQRRRAS